MLKMLFQPIRTFFATDDFLEHAKVKAKFFSGLIFIDGFEQLFDVFEGFVDVVLSFGKEVFLVTLYNTFEFSHSLYRARFSC